MGLGQSGGSFLVLPFFSLALRALVPPSLAEAPGSGCPSVVPLIPITCIQVLLSEQTSGDQVLVGRGREGDH